MLAHAQAAAVVPSNVHYVDVTPGTSALRSSPRAAVLTVPACAELDVTQDIAGEVAELTNEVKSKARRRVRAARGRSFLLRARVCVPRPPLSLRALRVKCHRCRQPLAAWFTVSACPLGAQCIVP